MRMRGGERESKGSARKRSPLFELNKKATSRGRAAKRPDLGRTVQNLNALSNSRSYAGRFSWGSVGSNNQLENRASAVSAVVGVGDQRKRVMMKTVESSESGQTLG